MKNCMKKHKVFFGQVSCCILYTLKERIHLFTYLTIYSFKTHNPPRYEVKATFVSNTVEKNCVFLKKMWFSVQAIL